MVQFVGVLMVAGIYRAHIGANSDSLYANGSPCGLLYNTGRSVSTPNDTDYMLGKSFGFIMRETSIGKWPTIFKAI